MTWKWRNKASQQNSNAGSKGKEVENGIVKDESKNKSEPAQNSTMGADAIVQTLWEDKQNLGNITWTLSPPKQQSKKSLESQNRSAIRVFKTKDTKTPHVKGVKLFTYYQIHIQNPALVAALQPIVQKQDHNLDLSAVAIFEAPFKALFFCYDEILDLCNNTDDESLKVYLKLLVQVLDDSLGEKIRERRQMQASGLVNYALAWTYFPTKSLVYSYISDVEMLLEVDHTFWVKKDHTMHLYLSCKHIVFDGASFTRTKVVLPVQQFSGNIPIVELDHYPLEFHPDADGLRQRMITRGKRVLDLQGLTHCTYKGVAKRGTEKHNVDGRILIDVVGFNEYERCKGEGEGDNIKDQLNLVTKKFDTYDMDKEKWETARPGPYTKPKVQASAHKKRFAEELLLETPMARKYLSEKHQLQNKEEMLSRPDELAIISPTIEGFALKNKIWLNFYIDDIAPITWNDTAYDNLVYDEEQKDLVLSLVENHGSTHKADIADFIVGKGDGLILLLSGPPGTGKTLMAEAVADKTHRPLFYLQAEDLGISAASLGENIKQMLNMAAHWNAVVLLDEADVFMAQRNPHDIARNELVSIFLRELEYSRGIIFLTTNLYSTIDTAFRSRMSLHLLFEKLSYDSRALIWRKFLGRVEDAEGQGVVLPDKDIIKLSEWSLNGREIKNVVKMVSKWCSYKQYKINLARLENGIRTTTPTAMTGCDEKELQNFYS